MLSRRTMLIVTGAAGASGLVGSVSVQAAAAVLTSTGEPALLESELQLVAALSEGIIPKTDTPGAIGAGVPEFFRTIFDEWFLKDEQIAFRASLKVYDDEAMRRFSMPFTECTAAQQTELMNGWDKLGGNMFAQPPHPFGQFKKLTLHGYYTSQVGLEVELKATMDAAENTPVGPLIQAVGF